MNWYTHVLKDNYANFSGRARRKEYWMFVLIQIGIFTGYGIVMELFGSPDLLLYIFIGYVLLCIIPWLALNVRRLHDQDKSGGYLFINLIPIIGRIWYIVLMASEGTSSANKYGPDPKSPNYEEIDAIGTE